MVPVLNASVWVHFRFILSRFTLWFELGRQTPPIPTPRVPPSHATQQGSTLGNVGGRSARLLGDAFFRQFPHNEVTRVSRPMIREKSNLHCST